MSISTIRFKLLGQFHFGIFGTVSFFESNLSVFAFSVVISFAVPKFYQKMEKLFRAQE